MMGLVEIRRALLCGNVFLIDFGPKLPRWNAYHLFEYILKISIAFVPNQFRNL
jgi:hypothetical protein